MPTSEISVPRPVFAASTAFYVVALLIMCACEMYLIRSLWFSQTPSPHGLRGADLAFLIWIPCCIGVILRFFIGKWSIQGEISHKVSARLNNWIGGLMLLAYLLIARLVVVAFS